MDQMQNLAEANTADTAKGCFKHDDAASTASPCPSTTNVSIAESSNALLEANSQTSGPVRPIHFEEFEYSLLPYDDSMRLLRLLPGSNDDELSCELFAARVSESPLYEAISYVWGNAFKAVTLYCNSKKLRITWNLASALRRIRNLNRPRTLWADGICIDQTNLEECGHQVRLMGSIYKNACQVLIHLGNGPSQDAQILHDFVSSWIRLFKEHSFDAATQKISDLPLEAIDRIITRHGIGPWKRFWDQPWFHRAWTVQEVGIASRSVILYEVYDFNWDFLMLLSSCFAYSGNYLLNQPCLSFNARRMWVSYDPHTRHVYSKSFGNVPTEAVFLYCLHQAVTSRTASQPLDMIYAFLGHPYAPTLQPAYHKHIKEVCMELAIELFSIRRSPALLSYASIDELERIDQDWPSWCPMWVTRPNRGLRAFIFARHPSTEAQFAASGDPLKYPFDCDIENSALRVTGVIFDVVRYTFGPIRKCHIFGDAEVASEKEPNPIVDALLHITSKTYVEKSLYLEPFKAISRTFSAEQWSADEITSWRGVYSTPCLNQYIKQHHLDTTEATCTANASTLQTTLPLYIEEWSVGRSFFITEEGRVGLGPPTIKPLDICAVIIGAQVPSILRISSSGRNRLVGEAYIHGAMDGEIVERMEGGKLKLEPLILL